MTDTSESEATLFMRLTPDGDGWQIANPQIAIELTPDETGGTKLAARTWLMMNYQAFGVDTGDVVIADWMGDNPTCFQVQDDGLTTQRDWSRSVLDWLDGSDAVADWLDGLRST